jgi:ribosomal protein S18 acetylase RimI-like enzyme
MSTLTYHRDEPLSADEFIDILNRSTLGERRPVDDRAAIEAMLANANLIVVARDADANGKLVGIARSVTDFAFCCYLSDLAVDDTYQRQGIGRELIRHTTAALGPKAKLILVAAPKAIDYYPRIGFTRHDSAWTLTMDEPLK